MGVPTRYGDADIARVKRLYLEARKETRLARGELVRIAHETGVSKSSVDAIIHGQMRREIEPEAPAT